MIKVSKCPNKNKKQNFFNTMGNYFANFQKIYAIINKHVFIQKIIK